MVAVRTAVTRGFGDAQVKFVILDEADMMLSFGFEEDVETILQARMRGPCVAVGDARGVGVYSRMVGSIRRSLVYTAAGVLVGLFISRRVLFSGKRRKL